MKIDDLPKFLISEINVTSSGVRLMGTFNNCVGVRNGRSWLLLPAYSLIGDLEGLDSSSESAVFVTPHLVESDVSKGCSLPWLDGYWQAHIVRHIADPEWTWKHVQFTPTDAIEFITQSGVKGWTEIGNSLPADSKYLGTLPNGWDHEHCEICNQKIGHSGDPFGYVDSENCWLCESCYQKYASQHDVSFVQIG